MSRPVSLWRRSLAELIGTFAIGFFGCGAIIMSEAGHLPAVAIPVVFGAVVAAMIYAFGHLSGAHFNPAVSFAFAITRHFPIRETAIYWSAQLAGGVLAILLLSGTFPHPGSYGATIPRIDAASALLWEALLTFFLMLVIMAVATDTRAVGTMAGMAIGATVMLDAFVGGWATGASMNPARSLAPALIGGDLSAMWIYVAGPMIGAAFGALCYRMLGKH